MDREHILQEIKRTAAANANQPLGLGRFETATGIRPEDWLGKYWARWSDAVREAGFDPNQMQTAYEKEFLLAHLVKLTRDLGKVPVKAEIMLHSRSDAEFPSVGAFQRLGSKVELVEMMRDFCTSHRGNDDVLKILGPATKLSENAAPKSKLETGFVYLSKMGRGRYKIGRTNSTGRRTYEVGLKLPDPLTLIHQIETDDPVGVERYWHDRFSELHTNGEWFSLSAPDIAAFKRWKRLV